ncbi:rubredoxin-like domain-containing protein [Desulforamulus aeronauticus]
MKKWKCKGCGALRPGDTAPEVCPICGGSNFVEAVEKPSK